MRVVAGKYKNRKLLSPDYVGTRPTADKVRESIFDVLNSRYYVDDCTVLDLFCGTGALGIEALSRGASTCIFVDKNPESVAITRQNLSFVKENTKLYNTDWQVALRKLNGERMDIIFLDPPYKNNFIDDVLNEIYANKLLADDGVIVLEQALDNETIIDEVRYDAYKKVYSGTSVTYLTFHKDGNDE